MHPVFYAKKLCKDPKNLLLGQINLKYDLIEVQEGEEEYEVQEVLAIKLLCSKLQYRVN